MEMANDGRGQKGKGREKGGSGLLRCVPLPSRGNTEV